jgi:hypothetical protein
MVFSLSYELAPLPPPYPSPFMQQLLSLSQSSVSHWWSLLTGERGGGGGGARSSIFVHELYREREPRYKFSEFLFPLRNTHPPFWPKTLKPIFSSLKSQEPLNWPKRNRWLYRNSRLFKWYQCRPTSFEWLYSTVDNRRADLNGLCHKTNSFFECI